MRKAVLTILTILMLVAAVHADDKSASLRKPPQGSLARQKLLRMRLQQISRGSLSEQLQHNRQAWEKLGSDERQQYRRRFLAFLQKSPQKQEELLERYEKLFEMSAQRRAEYRRRAQWLNVVIQSFDTEQRETLKKLTPEQRARKILQRKQELIDAGELVIPGDSVSSQPTSQPAE